MHRCNKCHEDKPATREFFSPDRRKRSGLQGICKMCSAKAIRDKIRERGGRSREAFLAIQAAPVKVCTKCGTEKPNTAEHFQRYARGRHTLWPFCRDCVRAYSRTDARRAAGREQVKTSAARARRAGTMKQWRSSHPDAVKAHRAVRKAKLAGTLVPHPCSRCGGVQAEAHHHKGYASEHHLDVEWLCKECHVTEHYGERVAA